MSRHNPIDIENHVVVFMDMHNFSEVMRTHEETYVEFLQEVYEQLGDIVIGHNGEVIKYMGDGIFAIFPFGSENKTVKSAFQMREVFSTIVKRRQLPADTELEIGISSGLSRQLSSQQ